MSEADKVGVDDTLRMGVVGVGVMSSNHARVLSELQGVKLVGVVDPDVKQRERVTRAVGCAAFDDLDALIRHGVDAITIAAPTQLHRENRRHQPRRGAIIWLDDHSGLAVVEAA
jgi:ornithine cyclodeaminase/alanine dehydrogenase-like protein (mu-crystallin family)